MYTPLFTKRALPKTLILIIHLEEGVGVNVVVPSHRVLQPLANDPTSVHHQWTLQTLVVLVNMSSMHNVCSW